MNLSAPADCVGAVRNTERKGAGKRKMGKRPRIQITIIDRKGEKGCHRGHKVGDCFDFDTERGRLCPMACHVGFPYIDILRYGGSIPGQEPGKAVFCCPDVDTINVFKIKKIEEEPGA